MYSSIGTPKQYLEMGSPCFLKGIPGTLAKLIMYLCNCICVIVVDPLMQSTQLGIDLYTKALDLVRERVLIC